MLENELSRVFNFFYIKLQGVAPAREQDSSYGRSPAPVDYAGSGDARGELCVVCSTVMCSTQRYAVYCT